MTTAPMVDYKIHWLKMMSVPESQAVVGRHDGINGRDSRCRTCWGGLIARSNEAREWTGIRCRVCGNILEGPDAGEETDRMWTEHANNSFKMAFGRLPEYEEGTFLFKQFPNLQRVEQTVLENRVKACRQRKHPAGKITRHGFPLGSPGILFMQAHILISGIESLSIHGERSVVEYPVLAPNDDGSVVYRASIEGFLHDPQYQEHRLRVMLGASSIQSLTAAFSCELSLKAISLTCKDEALAEHDLLLLYDDLPECSQQRLNADFPEIRNVVSDSRHVFGTWRYLEKSSGPQSLRPMIDIARTRQLAKAARVILDEADIVGLAGDVDVQAERQYKEVNQDTLSRDDTKIAIRGRESPPHLKP